MPHYKKIIYLLKCLLFGPLKVSSINRVLRNLSSENKNSPPKYSLQNQDILSTISANSTPAMISTPSGGMKMDPHGYLQEHQQSYATWMDSWPMQRLSNYCSGYDNTSTEFGGWQLQWSELTPAKRIAKSEPSSVLWPSDGFTNSSRFCDHKCSE